MSVSPVAGGEVDQLWQSVAAIEDALGAVRNRVRLLERGLDCLAGHGGDRSVPLGIELRRRRLGLGLTQAALAGAANCSRGLLSDLERGRRRSRYARSHLAAVLARLEGRLEGW